MTCVDYYTTHPPFNTSSNIAIAAVGTVALGLQYMEVLIHLSLLCILLISSFRLLQIFLISCMYGRYPDYMAWGMRLGLALYFVAIFGASFATQVWTHIFDHLQISLKLLTTIATGGAPHLAARSRIRH